MDSESGWWASKVDTMAAIVMNSVVLLLSRSLQADWMTVTTLAELHFGKIQSIQWLGFVEVRQQGPRTLKQLFSE